MPASKSDPFAPLIPDARAFLAELTENNTRDWFNAHKSRYEAQLRTPALRLVDEVAQAISRRTGAKVTGKLFRPQRDIRFSKDKTPYKTHLHMLWSIEDAEADTSCALFFGIDPARCTTGGGIMGFSPAQITRWRAARGRGDGGRSRGVGGHSGPQGLCHPPGRAETHPCALWQGASAWRPAAP